MKKTKLSIVIFLVLMSNGCTNISKKMSILRIDKTQFGETMDGIDVDQFILSNNKGMEVRIITYGGIITSWTAPDKNGDYKDIVLG